MRSQIEKWVAELGLGSAVVADSTADGEWRECLAKGEFVGAAGARFDLTPTQVVDLHARGLPLPVLEAIHTARERALNNDYAQKLVDLDRKCSADLQRERRVQRCPDPYWGRPGVWGGYPPRGGVYWGW